MEAPSRLYMNDVPSITIYGLNNSLIRTYGTEDNKLALNSTWNEDLLREKLLGLKSMEFDMDLLGFDPEEMANITLGREVNQPEYDESAADDVEMITCPECGKSFPR